MQHSLRKNSGQSLTEFVILFPIIMYFTLILIQTALIYNAYQIVNYAAYCSARAGIVHECSMQKMKKAASMAAVPIAGGKLPSTLSARCPEINLPQIQGVINSDDVELYTKKFLRAYLKTEVELKDRTDDEITVMVKHHFQLIVPGVGVLFVPILKIWDMPLSREARKSTNKFGAPHLPVKATCTLPM